VACSEGTADAYLDSDFDNRSGERTSQPTHGQHVMFAPSISLWPSLRHSFFSLNLVCCCG